MLATAIANVHPRELKILCAESSASCQSLADEKLLVVRWRCGELVLSNKAASL